MPDLRAVFAVGLVAGCVTDDSISETQQAAIKNPGECGSYGCGSNSPEIDKLGFHELHELGQPNAEGFWIARFAKQQGSTWITYTPDVRDGELYGWKNGAIQLKGTQLIGARFTLRNTNNSITYYIVVTDVTEMAMWGTPGSYTYDYRLEYSSSVDPVRRNVCKNAGAPTGDPMNPFNAVLFDDDRIDAEGIRVTGETPNWFNIGCAGHTLAKQHLTGHSKAAAALLGLPGPTSFAQRTAHLKNLSGDYCGTGDAFTVAGVELRWRDALAMYDSIVVGDDIEAMWTEAGARCVNTPRVEYSPTTLSLATFGSSIADDLTAFNCVLPPPCADARYHAGIDYGGAWLMSANY